MRLFFSHAACNFGKVFIIEGMQRHTILLIIMHKRALLLDLSSYIRGYISITIHEICIKKYWIAFHFMYALNIYARFAFVFGIKFQRLGVGLYYNCAENV